MESSIWFSDVIMLPSYATRTSVNEIRRAGNMDPEDWEAVAENRSECREKDRKGMRSEERGLERTAVGREESA